MSDRCGTATQYTHPGEGSAAERYARAAMSSGRDVSGAYEARAKRAQVSEAYVAQRLTREHVCEARRRARPGA